MTWKSPSAILLCALLVATGLVVALGFELRTTRAEFSAFAFRTRILQPGSYVPRLTLDLLEGNRLVLGDSAQRRCRILFVYNTTCPFCLASIPTWNDLAQRAHESGVAEAYGVSLDSLDVTASYSRTHRLTYPTALLLDARDVSLSRAGTVPQTVLVDSNGRVLYARAGPLAEAAVDSLWAALYSADASGMRACGSGALADT